MLRCALLLTTIGLCSTGQPAAGAIIEVPADQPTIGAAMLAAAPGDEIVVAPGTYSDGLQPLISSGFSQGKDLIIRSSGGPEVTILDGLGTVRLVELYQQESNAFVLEGFTLRNGAFADNWGGAMLLWDAAPTVRNCVFEMNDAHHGGAAATYYSVGAVFEDCVFRNNTARIGGGVANFYSEARYVDCVFEISHSIIKSSTTIPRSTTRAAACGTAGASAGMSGASSGTTSRRRAAGLLRKARRRWWSWSVASSRATARCRATAAG